LPLEDIARQLRLPLGTTKSRLYRARKALAGRLAEYHQGVHHA
jgi:DNA-directed RNA polymerase specialized sigma24 family protein